MIDPIHSLAFSLQSSPGIYALLLGSGVSRAARIPTGWEVTLELVRKVAHLRGEECVPTPEEWHRTTFGSAPDYSTLLDLVAKTPAERRQLLHSYFEASQEEREEGSKQPTAAHRAIAALVADGYLKVILTTNFDRLMERALEEVGITPTVISSVDHIKGAVPLMHTKCCVIKLHGDYNDTRILNTPSELASYPKVLDKYLDRIFDEFGLIICGWSAEWDEGLRKAITRAPSRRYTTYWAARGKLTSAAADLSSHRSAQVLQIEGADSFFNTLLEQVQSLAEFSRPHPLSTQAAVTTLKRYLADDKHLIQFSDLIDQEVERVVGNTRGVRFPLEQCPPPGKETLTPRLRAMEAECSTLIALSVIGGEWSKIQHYRFWIRSLGRLATALIFGGYPVWVDLQRYPAVLHLYALGIPAAAHGRFDLIYYLVSQKIRTWNGEDETAVRLLPPFWLSDHGPEVWRSLEGMTGKHAPLNEWIFAVLRPYMQRQFPEDKAFELAFDRFEVLLALAYAAHAGPDVDFVPPGLYGYRYRNRERIITELKEDTARGTLGSSLVQSGLIGATMPEVEQSFATFQSSISRLPWR